MSLVVTPDDNAHMARALALARSTVGLASPNPQVGCLLVRDGIVLGEGTHRYDAFDHAEIVALKSAVESVRGATAYVTLEPCSHHGRTGPCADALIAAGVARCVIATADPNPEVSGRGIARLRAAGIGVTLGVLEAEARTLNDAFAFSITHSRPFVTLKAALSVDGMLAPAHRASAGPFWLTGPDSRVEVHRLRHASDAILTGIGTVLADDPLLTDRTGLSRRRPLVRVILDTELRIPLTAKLVQTSEQKPTQDLWIFCGHDAPKDKRMALEARNIRVTAVGANPSKLASDRSKFDGFESSSRLNELEILAQLNAAHLRSMLLEAGSALNGAFIRANLVDRVVLFYAEAELGPDAIPFAAGTSGPFALEQRALSVSRRMFGPDVCVSGLLHDPWANVVELR